MTFTIWERHEAGAGVRLPGAAAPRQIVKDVRERNRLVDSMFIRLAPYAATGSWPARSRFAPRFERFASSLEPAGVYAA